MKIFLFSLLALFSAICLLTFGSTLWGMAQGQLAFFDSAKSGSVLSSTGVAGLTSAIWIGVALREGVLSRRKKENPDSK